MLSTEFPPRAPVTTPPFDEVLPTFKRFIHEQGFGTDVLWIFREDVTTYKRACWVRVPALDTNSDLARRYFEQGRRHGLGVTLEVCCRVGASSACFVWFPEDELAAEYAMQGSLKLRALCDPMVAIPVRSRLGWLDRRWLNRWLGWDKFAERLPSRNQVAR